MCCKTQDPALGLFLPALLAHEVGGAEAHEDGDAATQWGGLVLVGAVARQVLATDVRFR